MMKMKPKMERLYNHQPKKNGNGNGHSNGNGNGGDPVSEDLRDWFGSGPKGGKGGGGWDRYNTKGERIGKCARGEGEGKPKCLSNEKRQQKCLKQNV